MKDYNEVWIQQGISSADSMPVGGHDVGCNVWVQNNQLCIYLSQSGTFDENGTMLKLGRVRIWPENSKKMQINFRQTLELEKGQIVIEAGSNNEKVYFLIWVDVTNGNVHIEFETGKEEKLNISYDCWRYRNREVLPEERGQCRDLAVVLEEPLKDAVITRADCVENGKNYLWFYHKNISDFLVYNRLIKQQGLDEIQEAFPNWLNNRIMGGFISCPDIIWNGSAIGEFEDIDQQEYNYITYPLKKTEILISLETGQYNTVDQWKQELSRHHSSGISLHQNQEWWKTFFEKSFIVIDQNNKGSEEWKIGKNYQLFRYMLGCNYYGKWPTKFNGGLFTFKEIYTPDYRNWSGCDFTAQNQRLVYWPELKCGDFRAMKPQFDFYNNILKAGKMKTRKYWGHEGAYFSEQLSCFGMSTGSEYKWRRRNGIPAGEDDSPWVRMHYSTALEFALMIIAYADYSKEDIMEYMDFIDNVIRFYFVHYKKDDYGKLLIFPSTALETYKQDPFAVEGEKYGVTNPMDAVSGLRNLLKTLIRYLEKKGMNAEEYRKWYSECPMIPIGKENGKEIYLPAQKYKLKPFNCELPQLYPIFPFSYGGLSKEEIEIGKNTYNSASISEEQKLLISWHQNGIFAAKLKMTKEAMRIMKFKFKDANRRFPVFWGPGHDWTPDHNWGGSAMIGLQEMLIQVNGDNYELLPAWDKSIDVHFRLFIPERRIVECKLEAGKLEVKEEIW